MIDQARNLSMAGIFIVASFSIAWASDGAPNAKQYKIGGIQGHPAMHRGKELGWDRGYLAGKAESTKPLALAPDPSRHEYYNDPNVFYRYEFGRRSIFVRGFRHGFLKGYSDGLQQKVPYIPPKISKNSRYLSWTGAAMEMDGLSNYQPPPTKPRKVKRAKVKTTYSIVESDAL